MSKEREFLVMTPAYEEMVHIPGLYNGPMEWGRDVETVWATSKKEARRLGYHALKLQYGFRRWMNDCRGDGVNPLQVLEVEEQYTPETCPNHQVVAHPPAECEVGFPDACYCETCGYDQ